MKKEENEVVTEKKGSSFAHQVLKVIYAPQKAFKEISQNPKLSGPILIMILFIFASMGSQYAGYSKIYIQQTLPSPSDSENPDLWTQNSTMWTSNANISTNSQDYLLMKSIQFNITDDVEIWMELNDIGSIDCKSDGSYKNATFGMKWINAQTSAPQNFSIYLFSIRSTDYFYRNMSESINQTGNTIWNNITIPLGPSAEGWLNSTDQATWTNITSLKFELVWPESGRSNLTVLVDKLFFLSESFVSPLINFTSNSIPQSALNAFMLFTLNWMVVGLVLLIAARLFKIKADLKFFIVIAGYSLMAFVFMQVLIGIFYLAFPPLYFGLETVSPVSVFQTISSLQTYTTLLLPIWSILLAALGLRAAFDLPLQRSAMIAVIGFLPYYVLYFL